MPLIPRRLVIGFAFVVVLVVLGVAGFMVLDHESFLDALLTTVSAISTVGYSPPRPLGAEGKILAVVLILGGLFGIALVISVLTEYFMEGHLRGAWERRRMDKEIAKLREHFIISGFGRVGQEVARSFAPAHIPFVVVDINETSLNAARAAGYLYVQADASRDEVLQAVGVERAKGLIACADSDAKNLYVTLTARAANPDLFIVARAAFADAQPKLYKAGANRVVSPYVMAGRHMAQMAADPPLADSLNLLFDGRPIGVLIRELRAAEMPELIGHTIKDLHDTILEGAFVLAIDRGADRIQSVGPDLVVGPDDRLLVVGSGAQLERAATIK
jgi:voltage-gated potassium channel